MAFAGWITIGTRNDTSQFDRQMAQVEKQIERAEQKKLEIEVDLKNYEEESQKLDALREKKKQLESQLAQAKGRQTAAQSMAGGSQEVKTLESQLAGVTSQLELQSQAHDRNTDKIAQEDMHYQILNAEIAEAKAKLESIDLQKQQAQVKSLKDGFDNVGKSIQGSIKNVGRMIVGIFGLRSAYMALRQASSTLAQYDTTYAANLEYIRWALAQAIAPVLRYIVSLAATLLNYVYAILNAWFGLFGNLDLSAKAFTKMKAGAGGVAKAAKEIKKQLAGFDEMNVLQDTSSAGGGGGGGAGGGTPSFDLGAMQGEPPKWLQWIIDNKDLILSVIAGIAAGLLALKFGATGLQSLGIGIAIAGIVYAIQALIAYLQDPSFENFGKIITGIGIAIAGVGIATGNLIPVIVGVIIALFGVIVSHWEQIKSFIQEKIAWVESILNSDTMSAWAEDTFGAVGGPIVDVAKQGMNIVKAAFNFVDKQIQALKTVFDGVITFIKGIVKGFKEGDWSQAWEGIKKIALGVWDNIKATAELLWNGLVSMVKGLVDVLQIIITGIVDFIAEIVKWLWKKIVTDPIQKTKEDFTKLKDWLTEKLTDLKNKFIDLWDSFKNKASEAWNNVKSVFSNIGNFFGGIWDTIKSRFTDIGQRVGNAIGGAFRNAVNAVLSAAQRVINGPINAINRLINVINAVPGINLGRLSTISLPRLATGAIINMPNRGVNIGGAIAGESGREGILPLTDTRAMQMLGEEIGKWITINANITNTMNGRVISRELQKIQNDENFAYNS